MGVSPQLLIINNLCVYSVHSFESIINIAKFVRDRQVDKKKKKKETHVTETKYLSSLWKDKFESNCVTTNSAGVMTLFGNNFETVEVAKDFKW